MKAEVEVEAWPDRLEALIRERCTRIQRVRVVRETESSQDAARRFKTEPGEVVVAWNQTGGRGRLGRSWVSGTEGCAVTFVLEPGQTERLALAVAVGAARAAESLLDRSVGIKWPNDIVVDGRKLAGVLVEQNDQCALPAVGMNVLQTSWPESLADRAVSLRQLGASVTRIETIEAVIVHVDAALPLDDASLIDEFMARDILTGRHLRLREGGVEYAGTLLRLDPLAGLVVQSEAGEVVLPASTTTILGVT